MLGLGLQINKMVNRAGGLPPLASLLTFFSKERDDTTVINKLDDSGNSDAYLTVDPSVDIIDLSKYDIEDGTGDDLGWKVVKFNTINGEETYRVIYTAETVEGVKGLDDIPKSGDTNNYIMAKDIDLNNISNWISIGTNYTIGNAFEGSFNGNGHTISNLTITNTSHSYYGLFSSITNGSVSNLKISGIQISGSHSPIGALAGATVSSNVVNCATINGSIASSGDSIGGLIGDTYSFSGEPASILKNSYSEVSVTGRNYCGGLTGRLYGSEIVNSYSTGNVTGSGNYVGGLVGRNDSRSSIANSYSTGNVTGSSDYVGGLVGYNYSNSSIANSYSTGIVNNDETPTQLYVSAFCGRNSSSTIDSCFCVEHNNLNFSDTATGITNSGEKTELELKDILTYTTAPVDWDFANIWNIDPTETINNGYPYLRNLNGEYVSPYGTLTKIVTVNITETDPDDPHSYVKMPDNIKIGGLSLFNKTDPVIYDTTVSTNAEEYVSEDPYLWRVDELNTATILSYLNDAYKFTWFVKNTFTEGTYESLTIKEIFAYSQKIEDADDLSKIMKYLGINIWYDSQIWDNDAEWID